MRIVILISLLLLPVIGSSQEWTKVCVTETGVEVKAGDSLHINNVGTIKALNVINPHHKYTPDVWFSYRNHMAFMMNNTYEISRLSRVQVSNKPKTFKPIAIIVDKYASLNENVEYIVSLDSAINMEVVNIIGK